MLWLARRRSWDTVDGLIFKLLLCATVISLTGVLVRYSSVWTQVFGPLEARGLGHQYVVTRLGPVLFCPFVLFQSKEQLWSDRWDPLWPDDFLAAKFPVYGPSVSIFPVFGPWLI